MDKLNQSLQHLTELLVEKSTVKHHVYKNLANCFAMIEEVSRSLIDALKKERVQYEEQLKLEVNKRNENEFHLTVAGDTLVFVMHTNIIKFDESYHYNQSDYVEENPNRKFLGQINVYNFMADSLKYNRQNDPGYLILRLLIDCEGRFFVEGEKPMSFLYGNISAEPLSLETLQHLILLMIQTAIEQDLVIPAFEGIRIISLQQMDHHVQHMGGGNKIGFQMSTSVTADSTKR